MMGETNGNTILRYGIAVVVVGVAVLLRLLLDPLLHDRLPFITLFAAVTFMAWYAGRGPAVLVLLLSFAAVAFFVLEPRFSFRIEQPEFVVGMVFYAAIGVGTIMLFDQLRAAQERAEANATDARRKHDQLQVEMQVRTTADAALRDEKERLRVTLASIGDAVITTDVEGRVDFINQVASELTGWMQQEAHGVSLEKVFQIVNETTRQPVENPARRSLREGRILGLANHTILISKDGVERPINDSAAPILDQSGKIFGAVLVFRDVTEKHQAEQALQASEARKSAILETALDCIITIDHEGKVVEFNPAAERTFGYTREQVLGQELCRFIIPSSLRDQHRRGMARYLATGAGPVLGNRLELPALRADGSEFPVELAITRISTEDPPLFTAYLRDISDQKRANESSRYLAEASAALAGVVDYESTLQKVANLAVPYFADWSAVDMANGDGTLRRLAVAHQDADKIALVHRLMQDYPPDPESPSGAFAVLRTGKPQIIGEISDEMLVQGAKDERHLGLIRSLGLRSYICVPLTVAHKPLGVLTFATAESGRRYTDADLALAVDLAQRAGVAIENTQLYQALRDTDRRKDEFLATLAHELRNPLAPIHNSLQILKMPKVDPATLERARGMMERQVHHLVRLVDDLLDVSRVMRGKIDLRKERVELATVVARAVETVQSLAEAQGHQVNVRLPTDSLLIDADPVRLAQVIGNLLTNAAKYTEPKGCIWLTTERDGDMAVLRVRDTGIGIMPQMLPRIFELFVQVDNASTKTQGGLGIGLTLVKSLVEMHNGTVEAHSDGLGKGSEFIVRLPISTRAVLNEHGQKPERSVDLIKSSGRRLLVVDDNQDAAISLAMLLKLQGHEVRVAHSGPAALEMAKGYTPDVVFLDIGMPVMDGYEVARRLRQQKGLEKVVLAAVTGWGQQEDRRRTAEAGFNHHLLKPPEPEALASVLASVTTRP